MPTDLSPLFPVQPVVHAVGQDRTIGLVIVDEVNGFCTVDSGPLAPPAPDAQVARMVKETLRLARRFEGDGRPIMAFLDTHQPGKPERPYPPHCEIGTGQELLVPELRWLETSPVASILKKDCINGFVGAIGPTGRNQVLSWLSARRIETLVVVGICTDICVLQFVQTLLSARNHGMTPLLQDVVVYEPGCATYDLPLDVARSLGLPDAAAHPQAEAHHLGLYLMQSSGAVIAKTLEIPERRAKPAPKPDETLPAAPAVEKAAPVLDAAGTRRPSAGDAVRIVGAKGWWSGVKDGTIAIIEGTVGRPLGPDDRCSITVAYSSFRGKSSEYGAGPETVGCSGGPGSIATPAGELRATDETLVVEFWRWKDLPRAQGGVKYRLEVPVWEWSPGAAEQALVPTVTT